MAISSGLSTSEVASATYTIPPPAVTPVITPPGGPYSTSQFVTITDATPGATIHFTRDGTTPTTASPVYTAPFTVNATETVLAIATVAGFTTSAIATAAFTIVPILTRISIQAPRAALNVGATIQLVAVGSYSDGSEQDLTSQAAWTSSDVTVAAVSGSGLVSGLRAGAAVVTASSPPFNASLPMSVLSTAVTYCYDVAGNMTAQLTCPTDAPCEARCP